MNRPYKKPSPEEFERLVQQSGGNLSTVARALKVRRNTIDDWRRADPEFDQIVKNDRMSLYDQALSTAKILALGIPAYESDANGNKKLAGWIERPSERMVQMILGRFGNDDGFGDDSMEAREGIPIKAWIQRMNRGDEEE